MGQRRPSSFSRAAALVGPLTQDAFQQLVAESRQHVLTLIGLLWGTAAVVILISVGAGFYRNLEIGFEQTGDRWTLVKGRYTTLESGGTRPGRSIEFTRNDLERLRASVGTAGAIAGVHDGWGRTVRTAHHTRANGYVFATPEIQQIQRHRVARGRFYDAEDEREGRRVAVIGANLAEVFFGDEDPLGQRLEIDGKPFRVLGVLAPKGNQVFTSNEGLHDDLVFVPLRSAQEAFGLGDWVEVFFLDPRRIEDVEAMHDEIRRTLWPAHHIHEDDEHAIQFMSITDATLPLRKIGVGLQVLLGLVGTVTLGMAGVGVANLMIAGVNRRRIELGMRRACGARRADLVLQLLVETTTVVLSGGTLGVLAGVGIVLSIGLLPLPSAVPEPRISPSVLATSFAVLAAVGLCAGVAPARVAARLDPSAVLRVS